MPRFFGLKGAYHAFGRLAQRELGSFVGMVSTYVRYLRYLGRYVCCMMYRLIVAGSLF